MIGILYHAGALVHLPPDPAGARAWPTISAPPGSVSHGWLGVKGATASGSGGARVAALMTGSPATGLLHPGDVVMAMGSVPIRSMADLRARLYVHGARVEGRAVRRRGRDHARRRRDAGRIPLAC